MLFYALYPQRHHLVVSLPTPEVCKRLETTKDHFQKYHDILCSSLQNFCISIVSSLSWDLQWSKGDVSLPRVLDGQTGSTMVFLKVAYDLSSKPNSRGDLWTVQVEGSHAQTASGRQVQGRFLLQLFHRNHYSSLSQLPLILWHIHTWGVLLCNGICNGNRTEWSPIRSVIVSMPKCWFI